MKVMIVDDEPLLLAYLEKLLSEIDGIQLKGKFTNPNEAINFVMKETPDVVFLDIEMPELSGIEAAEKIQSILPMIHIVFVTGYSEHAVKAFELNAVDYLLKPINKNRLTKTIHRLQKRESGNDGTTQNRMICCFNTLQFINHDSLIKVHWRTNKARELFLYLLQHHGQPVRKDVILDLFWPATDLDKSHTQMYTTIYQIRKTLKLINFPIKIKNYEDNYILELNEVKLDVAEWEQGIKQNLPITEDSLSEYQKIMELYQGDYLAEAYYIWAEAERERLRELWYQQVKKMADYFSQKRQYTEAVTLYKRVQELQPYLEDSYFVLMQLYERLSNRYLVERQYEKLTKMLAEQFNMEPNEAVQSWYRSWKELDQEKISM